VHSNIVFTALPFSSYFKLTPYHRDRVVTNLSPATPPKYWSLPTRSLRFWRSP